jgi:adenosylcobyric acid synthase
VILERPASTATRRTVIACPILPRIANFDDLDPLKLEPSIDLVMVPPGRPIPAQAALVILPGSKATIADLAALRAEGWDIDLVAHHRRGGMILGLCGGYQMLGSGIADPDGLEGMPATVAGLGLLDVTTRLATRKALRQVDGVALGAPVTGYEMHMGVTTGPATVRAPLVRFADGRRDGACSPTGTVMGTYVHGLLAHPAFRHALLARIGVAGEGGAYHADVDAALDAIAGDLERHLDMDGLIALAQEDMGS